MNETLSYQQAMVLVDRAFRLQMQGQLGDAIELYEKSLDLYPTAKAHTWLGWTYSMMGRYDEAIEQCEHAIILDPQYGNPYNDIGAYLIELDKPEESLTWFEHALEVDDYETPWFALMNLGRAWYLLGKPMLALKFYDQALGLDPAYRPALHARATLLCELN